MRIIGIRIFGGDSLVLKNLKPGWYPLGEYQEPTDNNNYTWQTKQGENADKWLNRLYQSVADDPFAGKMTLSVNCIVGANGSGKSTLLELMLRIINNISVYLIDEQWMPTNGKHKAHMGHDMTMANGFAAELLYEVDGNLYGMMSDDLNGFVINGIKRKYAVFKYIKIEDDKEGRPRAISITPLIKMMTTKKLKEVLGSLFYTIYTNYSIYSLNENDYTYRKLINENKRKKVDGKWIHGLLHKNDGYLAPAVMIPFRENDGIINIKTERKLSKQRLSVLALLFESQHKPFLDGYKPDKISFAFRENSEKEYYLRFMKECNLIEFLYDNNKQACREKFWEILCKVWTDRIADYADSCSLTVFNTAVCYLAYKTR